MEASVPQSKQGMRLVQVGLSLFLAALFVGLAIPRFAAPRLALSAHLLGLLQGMFLIVVGLLWARLQMSASVLRLTFGLLVYGCLAAWSANLLAAAWGAGNTILPLAAGAARGSSFQETVIVIALRSAGASLIVSVASILWAASRSSSRT